MWQLETEAVKVSSGSTPDGFDHKAGTICGDDDLGTMAPPYGRRSPACATGGVYAPDFSSLVSCLGVLRSP